MKRITLLTFCCLLLIFRITGYGQTAQSGTDPVRIPAGISWDEWDKMNKRWQPYATQVDIQLNDGSTVAGQLSWMSDELMMIRTRVGLPEGWLYPGDHKMVRIGDIASMKVRLGGHPYKGLIIGMVAGVVPGFVTGLILAQGWTILPAIIFGTVTAAGGGVSGSLLQKAARRETFEMAEGDLTVKNLNQVRKTALFPQEKPSLNEPGHRISLTDFERLVTQSPTLQRAFPVNPWSLSIHSSVMTNSVRKRLQNWYMSPLWGPSDPYFETRIGLEANLSRQLGKRFQAGLLLNLFPGDISSSFFTKNLPDWNVNYSYNHHFKQTTAGLYGGWILHPVHRFWARRLETSLQAGIVVSDVYEHFYFQWSANNDYTRSGETFIRQHNFQPGAMLRINSSWYLIPGFSIDAGLEGFWIKKIQFDQRDVLPETAFGPTYIGQHRLNFSNLQGYLGVAIHL